MFMELQPRELLAGIWETENKYSNPTLKRFIDHLNGFSYAVAMSVITGPNPEARGKIFKRWIDVSQTCLEMRNYHGMFSVIYGLTHKSVSRLYDTQKYAMKTNRLRKSQYETMCNLCQPNNDFHAYREIIKSPVTPCVPFLGCFQKDLVYVQESYKNKVNDLINFKKCKACARLVIFVQDQKKWYPINKNARILEIISEVPREFDTIAAMKESMAREKPK